MYVDDLVCLLKSEEEVRQLSQEATQIFSYASTQMVFKFFQGITICTG